MGCLGRLALAGADGFMYALIIVALLAMGGATIQFWPLAILIAAYMLLSGGGKGRR